MAYFIIGEFTIFVIHPEEEGAINATSQQKSVHPICARHLSDFLAIAVSLSHSNCYVYAALSMGTGAVVSIKPRDFSSAQKAAGIFCSKEAIFACSSATERAPGMMVVTAG